MANHVYFTISLDGLDEGQFEKHLATVKGKRNDYDGNEYEYEALAEIENQPYMSRVEKSFDKDGYLEGSYDWYCNNVGAKWCNIEECESDFISGYSAWRQPHELVLNILEFYANEYDKEVEAVMTYEDEFRNFLGKQYYGVEHNNLQWTAYEGDYQETDGDELVRQFEKKFGIDTSAKDFDWYEEIQHEGETLYPSEEMDTLVDEFWSTT